MIGKQLSRVLTNVLELPGLVVADQLAQRWLVHFVQNVAELVRICAAFGEIDSVGFAQGADQCVAVLSADFAVLVTMPLEDYGRPPFIL